jgi:hypothetical protein
LPRLATRVPATRSYRQTVTHVTEELDFLSTGDLEWMMGRGLADCLRWPVGQPQPA